MVSICPGQDNMRCKSGKRQYKSPVDAMLGLQRIQRQRDIDNLEKHERTWYPCTDCQGIHLTSQTEEG